jgi:Lrp/AsnC family transcriptional regulator, leucine-responsive regulatory protein
VAVIDDLDRIDLKILAELSGNGRLSWRELADNIGLSLTPTLRRVRQLEKSGYITGYSAHLDESRLAGGMNLFVSITLEKQSQDVLNRFEREIAAAPQVMSCFLMTGDADYILRVVVEDLAGYQNFLTSMLTKIPGVAHIKSSFALKAVLNRQAPLLPTSVRRKHK